MQGDFFDLPEKEKNSTLNVLYHDYGLSEETIEALDLAWQHKNGRKTLDKFGLVIEKDELC